PLADALHRRAAGAGGGGDLLVGVPLIGQEQDLEVSAPSAVERLAFEALGQFGALLGGQSNEGRLAQGASPGKVEERPVSDPRTSSSGLPAAPTSSTPVSAPVANGTTALPWWHWGTRGDFASSCWSKLGKCASAHDPSWCRRTTGRRPARGS